MLKYQNYLLLFFLSFLLMFVISCDKEQKREKSLEKKTQVQAKGIIEYELYKVENGDLIDVVFKITNLTNQPKQFEQISQRINANLKVQKKYIKEEKKSSEVYINEDIKLISIKGNERWENPPSIYGIATQRGNFTLKPGSSKEYMIFSAFKRSDLLLELGKRKSRKVLIRAEFTNPGDIANMTNEIELQ